MWSLLAAETPAHCGSNSRDGSGEAIWPVCCAHLVHALQVLHVQELQLSRVVLQGSPNPYAALWVRRTTILYCCLGSQCPVFLCMSRRWLMLLSSRADGLMGWVPACLPAGPSGDPAAAGMPCLMQQPCLATAALHSSS
jgi:hypothetical protein